MNEKQSIATLLEHVTTVGELIEQLKQFDPKTPFSPHQRVMYIKLKEKECITITEVHEVH